MPYKDKEMRKKYNKIWREEEKKIKGKGSRITEEEKKFIIKNYQTKTCKQIGKILGRKPPTIREWCYRNKVRKTPPRYSKEEKGFIKKNYKNMRVKDIAKKLGRSMSGISSYASIINAQKSYAEVIKEREMGIKNLSEWERGYLAGIIDGEGTITLGIQAEYKLNKIYFKPKITISNTNKKLMNWISPKMTIKTIFAQRNRKNRKWKDCYNIEMNGYKILPILKMLYPYLIIKKENCKILINWIERRKNKMWKDKYSELDKKQHLQIRRLNLNDNKYNELIERMKNNKQLNRLLPKEYL